MMIRKIVIGLASASALTLAASAMADNSANPYIDTHPTKDSGFYAAIQTGYGWTGDYKNFKGSEKVGDTTFKVSTKTGGFDGRVSLGYSFNQYFAVEAGYAYMPILSIKAKATSDSKRSDTATSRVNLYAIDLMGIARYPISNSIYAFGGAGVAYVNARSITLKSGDESITYSNNGNGYVRPKAELGMGYKISPDIALTVEYSRIFKVGDDSTPNINALTGGMVYSF